MNTSTQAKLDQYLDLYDEIKQKVRGDERAALMMLQELTKDRRMEEIREERELKNGEPVTSKQLEYLKVLGVEITPGLTKKQASILIDNALDKVSED